MRGEAERARSASPLFVARAQLGAVRWKDYAFWTVPAAIAGVAAVLGVRALRSEGPELPSTEPEPPSMMCPVGVYRCIAGSIAVTTGEENVGGETPCLTREVGRCAVACVAETVPLAGVSDEVAKGQLCDAPADVSALVEKELTITDLAGDSGEPCLADGFGPSDDGVLQCILQSAKDPDALGIVVGRITCRSGVVRTFDPTPRIVSREQAIALWCRRDAAGVSEAGVTLDGGRADAVVTDGPQLDADAADSPSDAETRD